MVRRAADSPQSRAAKSQRGSRAYIEKFSPVATGKRFTTRQGRRTRRRVLALHRKGKTAAEIAAALGVTPTCVRYHLCRSGIVPAADRLARWTSAREKFVATWNASRTLTEVATALGMSAPAVNMRAFQLRNAFGLPLKDMPRRK